MQIIFKVISLIILTKFVTMETTKEPLIDVHRKTTNKIQLKDVSSSNLNSHETNPHINSLLVHNSASREMELGNEYRSHSVISKEPYSLTKLAKSLSFGVNPYFSKSYFEPFERRPKPVTLVAFRKNGLVPRKTLKVDPVKSSEVAELQSPYNVVSSFWQNEPDKS